ncbi:MAG: GNAT family N-acetyltransferase [Candidatus Methylomirabilales bacterium]
MRVREVKLVLTKCAIRSWRPGDVPALFRHANNRQVWRNLRDRFPHPYTARDAEDWIGRATAAVPETHFAIAIGDEAVGGIGLDLQTEVHRRSAELGFWLGEPYWGRGIATEAVRAMTDFAFATFDLCRVYAGVFEWNPASMRVLEKAGYSCEGRLRKSVTKDGQTIDQMLYAIVRE